MTSPYDRLMAEDIPTRPPALPKADLPPTRPIQPWTSEEQAQHLADMLAALHGWTYREPDPETHLRLVEPTDTADPDHERHSA
ncbi:hypothetical protein AB0N17_03235 [Streptomyces sp. NPDC051133]|uniref:hypothetical protein n=1 Tax=Streptomyces sp. NPDC051133 TaxID=3155521 RepID=UPI0034358993